MLCGLATLLYLRWALRLPGGETLQTAVNVEKFWHFLGLIWLVMFVSIFVF